MNQAEIIGANPAIALIDGLKNSTKTKRQRTTIWILCVNIGIIFITNLIQILPNFNQEIFVEDLIIMPKQGYYHVVKSASGKVHVTTSSKGVIKAVCGSIMKYYSTFKGPDDGFMSVFFKHENRCERCENFLYNQPLTAFLMRDFHNTKRIDHKEHIRIPNFNTVDPAQYKSGGKVIFPILSGSVLHYTSHDRTKIDFNLETLCNIAVENRSKRDDSTLVQIDRGIIPVYKCTKC